LTKAIDTICQQARSQGSRIWIDAEQQIFQPSIDAWTTDLMRRHNIHGDALVFTTIQTYLKSSRETIAKYLQSASDEGWTLGIKQVRGAYIASDVRERIWDTKAETDESYNSIARDLLSKNMADGVFPGFKAEKFPDLRLFLAGHNTESIRLATAFVRELTMAGKQVPHVQYGQLHGMADDVSCDLVQQYERAAENLAKHKSEGKAVSAKYERELQAAPVVYKCLNWGSVQECLHFLLRRAVENASAAERIKDGLPDLRAELKRRLLRTA
jgi:proline dehydrogenase